MWSKLVGVFDKKIRAVLRSRPEKTQMMKKNLNEIFSP